MSTETDFLFPELTPLRASYPQLLRWGGGMSGGQQVWKVAPEARGRFWHSFLLGFSTLLLEIDSGDPIWDIPFPIQRAKLRTMETWPTGFNLWAPETAETYFVGTSRQGMHLGTPCLKAHSHLFTKSRTTWP